MMCELEVWKQRAAFVTLTYDDEHLPVCGQDGPLRLGSLSTIDAERWLKRLRKAIEPRRFRFYLAGEYGSDKPYFHRGLRRFVKGTERPHYHAIVFGLDPFGDKQVLGESWPFGHVVVGTVTADSIRYVADYVIARLTGDEAARVYKGRTVPFSRMSQGLGRDWCDARAEELRESLAIMHRGVTVGLPRYFAKRLGITDADTIVEKSRRWSETMLQHLDEFGEECKGEFFDWPSVRRSNYQNLLDAEGRARVKPRGKM